MRSSFVALALVALVAGGAVASSSLQMVQTNAVKANKAARAPAADLCPFCVSTMGQIMDQLIQIILNGGVLGSCSALCGQLSNEIEATACNLLCDYVGIETFVKVLQYEDPDPIYVCQLIDICGHVNGGKANMTSVTVAPSSGPQGTTFAIRAAWSVTSPTGPGGLNIVVIPQGGMPISGGSFIEGQAVGNYDAQFTLKATPSEQEPFSPGAYQVQIALCEGDCSTKHPWGGVYAEGQTRFTITQQ